MADRREVRSITVEYADGSTERFTPLDGHPVYLAKSKSRYTKRKGRVEVTDHEREQFRLSWER